MGVYTNAGAVDNAPLLEGYEPDMSGAFKIVYENELNFNGLMMSIGISELAALEETGAEVVYEAGNISAIIEKGKQFIDKVIEKVKAIFNKFLSVLASFTKSNKEFIKKYEKEILLGDLTDLEIKGYTFTIKDLKTDDAYNKMHGEVLAVEGFGRGEVTEAELRKDIYKYAAGKEVDNESELAKALFETLRNGQDSKDTIEITSTLRKDAIEVVRNYDSTKKLAEAEYKKLKKNLENLKKGLEKKMTSKGTSDEDITKAQNAVAAVSVCKASSNAMAIMQSAHLKALKDRLAQSKAICLKCIGRKAPKNESTVVEENGFLGNFELV